MSDDALPPNDSGRKKPPRKPKYTPKNLPLAPLQITNNLGLPTKHQPPAKTNAYKIPFEDLTGRPSSYNDEVGVAICGLRAQGMPITRICKIEGMPTITTVYNWLRIHPSFLAIYTRAEEDMADTLAAEVHEISDEVDDDKYLDTDGKLQQNHVGIQRAKLRIEARKWTASKLKSKKWGDKIIHQGDSEQPLVTQLVIDGDALAEKLRKK
jgi:hypothetical protein